MSEPPATPRPGPGGPSTPERGNDALMAAADGLGGLAHELAAHLAGRELLGPHETEDPRERRRTALATLDALDQLGVLITRAQDRAAREAGAHGATYADLARAAGLTREGARSRWPGAVSHARPGRPKKQVRVRFRGGPAGWDGYEMDYPASTLEGELEGIGAYLVVDGDQAPEDAPADARAHYAPESDDTRHVWVFQGWVPA